MTRAAKVVGRTQPSVSHSLNRLREIFADELFFRVGGEMEPTPRASELSIAVGKALSDLRHAIEQNISFIPEESTRTFRLCVSDYTAIIVLQGLIQSFAIRAPNATLNVVHAQNFEVGRRLKKREIDCAIVGDYNEKDERIAEELLSEDRMVCAGWKGNTTLPNISLENYIDAQHLQISSDGQSPGLIDKALHNLGLERKTFATEPYYLAIPFVLEGTEILTSFGDSMLLALPPECNIRIFSPPFEIPNLQIKLLYEKGMSSDSGRAWFIDLIREVISRQDSRKKGLYEHFLAT